MTQAEDMEAEQPEKPLKGDLEKIQERPGGALAPEAPSPGEPQELSRGATIAAFSVAIASDVIAAPLSFFPFLLPLEIGIDVVTAIILSIIFKGVDLLIILSLVLELPPFVASLPWWTVIVYAKCKGVRVEGLFKLLASKLPARKP